MPASFTYPGVYVSERESGARAVPAAATSVAMFIGMAGSGPIGSPRRIQSLDDFQRTFGETSPGELALQVQQFFINGGGDTYVMRIANGAAQASIDINNAAGTPTLRLTSNDFSASANDIRAEVSYEGDHPDARFSLTVFRKVPTNSGSYSRQDVATYDNLSMDPDDPLFVDTVVDGTDGLVSAQSLAGVAATTGGVSVSGLFFSNTPADARDHIAALVDEDHRSFRVQIGALPIVTAEIDHVGITGANLDARIKAAIEDAYSGVGVTAPEIGVSASFPVTGSSQPRVLEIASTQSSVTIRPALVDDLAALLHLGVEHGGAEFDAYSPLRPAPSGLAGDAISGSGVPAVGWLQPTMRLANAERSKIGELIFTDPGTPIDPGFTAPDTQRLREDPGLTTPNAMGSLNAYRGAMDEIAQALATAYSGGWNVTRTGLALHLTTKNQIIEEDGAGAALSSNAGPDLIGGASNMFAQSANIATYTLGQDAIGGQQGNPAIGSAGVKPGLSDYTDAFDVIREEVEIFNLMALPRADAQTDTDRQALWGAASSFCAEQRAILLVDPYEGWAGIDGAETGADTVKLGVDTRHAAVYWPRILVPTPSNTAGEAVDPCGSMAGLYARTDTRFGTWRAPAGIQATLTGVVGVEHPMGDMANGRINPKALNAIRQFPSGITSWGARTMVGADDTGNVDDKYVNVRRTMLFIENSLYRGLRFAVFRNNSEPLWAQIRLAAGSFMNSLMLQGAFASTTKDTAYYVQCDASTTTPTDVNLGIVNVVVGFAPSKPAEFVHLTVTQIAGQTEV